MRLYADRAAAKAASITACGCPTKAFKKIKISRGKTNRLFNDHTVNRSISG